MNAANRSHTTDLDVGNEEIEETKGTATERQKESINPV